MIEAGEDMPEIVNAEARSGGQRRVTAEEALS